MGSGRALVVGVIQPGLSNLPAVPSDYTTMVNLFRESYGWRKDDAGNERVVGLWGKDATASEVLKYLNLMARDSQPGDLAVFYYSGHGGTAAQDGNDAETFDSTLCLYDRNLRDDLLGAMWPRFAFGVRIVVLTDSCHSGTVVREIPSPHGTVREIVRSRAAAVGGSTMFATRPHAPSLGLRRQSAAGARGIQQIEGLQADLLHLAGCRDEQESFEGSDQFGSHGYFTNGLLRGLGARARNYDELVNSYIRPFVTSKKGNIQEVQYTTYGFHQDAFRGQVPFDVSAAWPPR